MQTQQSSRIRMDANEEKSVQKKVLRWNAHSNKIMKLLSHLNYYLLGSVCELALSCVGAAAADERQQSVHLICSVRLRFHTAALRRHTHRLALVLIIARNKIDSFATGAMDERAK